MTHLEFTKDSYNSLLSETTFLMPRYLESLKVYNTQLVSKLRANDFSAEGPELAILADKLACLISLFSIVYRDCKDFCHFEGSNASIKQIKINLLSILKAIKTAEQNGDEAMLVDLLEYELQDNLTQWKITAIPQIKKILREKAA